MTLKQILGVSTALVVIGVGAKAYNYGLDIGQQREKTRVAQIEKERIKINKANPRITVNSENLRASIWPTNQEITYDTNLIKKLTTSRLSEISAYLGMTPEEREKASQFYSDYINRTCEMLENSRK